jgi:hypothetical protein
MRYVYFPYELEKYNPTWINGEFLQKAIVEKGSLVVGDARYKALYLDAEYVSYSSLQRIAELAGEGLPVIIKKIPKEPGTIKHPEYPELLEKMSKSKRISSGITGSLTPFISSNSVPKHWCRIDGDSLYIFFPNPESDWLKFPLEYGQSFSTDTIQKKVTIQYLGKQISLDLRFEPYQSLLFKIVSGEAQEIDISFIPKTPVVRSRPVGYKAPWLVE